MLDNVAVIFENKKELMKHLKKKNYETNMLAFEKAYGHYFKEMTQYVESADNKEEAAKELAAVFVQDVKEKCTPKNKKAIPSYMQVDMNLFMIYYVFPAILLTGHEDSKLIADALCEKWGSSFKDSIIGYTTYDELYNSFKEKIFGIF